MDRRDARALGVVALALVGLLVLLGWVTEPPSAAPRSWPAAEVTADGRQAAAFCALVLTRPELEPSYGAAYAYSGDPDYGLLTALALQWGASGEPGAREQVAVQCRREGLGR